VSNSVGDEDFMLITIFRVWPGLHVGYTWQVAGVHMETLHMNPKVPFLLPLYLQRGVGDPREGVLE
jgi:hypothetical protein